MIIDDIKTIIIQYVTPNTEYKLKYIPVWKNIRMHHRMAMVNELTGYEPRWYNRYVPHEALKFINVKQLIAEHIMLSELCELLELYKPVKTEIKTADDLCKYIATTAKKMITREGYYYMYKNIDKYDGPDGTLYNISLTFSTCGPTSNCVSFEDIIKTSNSTETSELLTKLNISELNEDHEFRQDNHGVEYVYSRFFTVNN
jgi:hypothetical protein